jgi:tetratricopeptide (TPR) repeat protein
MSPVPSEIDLIARATHFAEQGQSDRVFETLDACLREYPNSALAHYLSAAESAQNRQYERAARHFEAALALQPGLHEARLQFGLLLLTMGMPDACIQTLGAIDAAKSHPAIAAFAEGLSLLAQDRLDVAMEALQRGLALRHPNVALGQDMKMLAAEIERTLRDAHADDTMAGAATFFLQHYNASGR